MEEFELPTFGSDGGGEQSLEVPPDLDPPETKEAYDVAGIRQGVASAAVTNRVLPQHLGMRLRNEGNVTWLAVSATPDSLWPHAIDFWRNYGFEIADESMLRGYIETGWREQRFGVDGLRVRDMFRMRFERAPDAVTNIYLANRRAAFKGGKWHFASSDREIEVEILDDLVDYLASQREVKSVEIPPFERVRVVLKLRDFAGAPALIIGQPYNRVWRGLGVALDRAGLSVSHVDQDRGVYLIRYRPLEEDGQPSSAEPRFLQLRLLPQRNRTLITVHPNRRRGAALAYKTAHEVLRRIVMTYTARA